MEVDVKKHLQQMSNYPNLVINGTTLRNVAPKPVRYERWVNLYENGGCTHHITEHGANNAALGRVECRRIVWNSDGSPVEDATVAYTTAECGTGKLWPLHEAVSVYQDSQPFEIKSYEKTCNTCRFADKSDRGGCKFAVDVAMDCQYHGLSEWEQK